jgi:hypothetical protein
MTSKEDIIHLLCCCLPFEKNNFEAQPALVRFRFLIKSFGFNLNGMVWYGMALFWAS